MPNTIKTPEWKQLTDYEWETPVEGGKVVIYRALDKKGSYIAVFIPSVQADLVGVFASLDEAQEGVSTWIGDSDG